MSDISEKNKTRLVSKYGVQLARLQKKIELIGNLKCDVPVIITTENTVKTFCTISNIKSDGEVFIKVYATQYDGMFYSFHVDELTDLQYENIETEIAKMLLWKYIQPNFKSTAYKPYQCIRNYHMQSKTIAFSLDKIYYFTVIGDPEKQTIDDQNVEHWLPPRTLKKFFRAVVTG